MVSYRLYTNPHFSSTSSLHLFTIDRAIPWIPGQNFNMGNLTVKNLKLFSMMMLRLVMSL